MEGLSTEAPFGGELGIGVQRDIGARMGLPDQELLPRKVRFHGVERLVTPLLPRLELLGIDRPTPVAEPADGL